MCFNFGMVKMFRSFLKNLFKKTKDFEEIKIELDGLASWFETESKRFIEDANNSLEPITKQLKAGIKETEENIEKLKNAVLSNPNISEREKQFMEGNRNAYIKAVRNFLNEILLVNDVKLLQKHYNGFDTKLDSFAKSTTRSYYILQEFFSRESSLIARNIKNISNLVNEINVLVTKKNIDSLKSIKNLIIGLRNKVEKKKRLEEELKRKLTIEEEIEKRLILLKKEINELEESNEKKNLVELINKKEDTVNKRKELEKDYLYYFSLLKKPLSKYIRVTIGDTALLNRYILNPIDAIHQDKELGIVELLNKMTNNIKNNQIVLDKRKKKRVLSILNKLNRNYFKDFLLNKKGISKNLEKVKQEINKNMAYQKQALLTKKQNENILELDKIKKEVNFIKGELDKLAPQGIKNEVKDKIFKVLQVKISIE